MAIPSELIGKQADDCKSRYDEYGDVEGAKASELWPACAAGCYPS